MKLATKDHPKVKRMLAEEALMPLRYWYLSFADSEGFRGAAIVRARGITSAIMVTHNLGINPGGEVLGREISQKNEYEIKHNMTNKLLTKADLEDMFGKLSKAS